MRTVTFIYAATEASSDQSMARFMNSLQLASGRQTYSTRIINIKQSEWRQESLAASPMQVSRSIESLHIRKPSETVCMDWVSAVAAAKMEKRVWLYSDPYEDAEHAIEAEDPTTRTNTLEKFATALWLSLPRAKKFAVARPRVRERLMVYHPSWIDTISAPTAWFGHHTMSRYGKIIYVNGNEEGPQDIINAVRIIRSTLKTFEIAVNCSQRTKSLLQEADRSIIVARNEKENFDIAGEALAHVHLPDHAAVGEFRHVDSWMACKPIIEFNLRDSQPSLEYLISGRNGYFCRTEDDLASVLINLSSDVGLAQIIGESGHKTHIEKNMTWDAFLRTLLS